MVLNAVHEMSDYISGHQLDNPAAAECLSCLATTSPNSYFQEDALKALLLLVCRPAWPAVFDNIWTSGFHMFSLPASSAALLMMTPACVLARLMYNSAQPVDKDNNGSATRLGLEEVCDQVH